MALTRIDNQDIADRPDSVVPEQVEPDEFRDETRPAKRTKLDGALSVTENMQQEVVDEDWDNLYDDDVPPVLTYNNVSDPAADAATPLSDGAPTEAPPRQPDKHQYGLLLPGLADIDPAEVAHRVPPEPRPAEDELVAPIENADKASTNIMEGTKLIEYLPSHTANESETTLTQADNSRLDPLADLFSKEPRAPPPKATEDPEFMAAAAAQKDNKTAEWQFDESDAETSDSDSPDDDDDSDSSSESDFEIMDPATQAKVLMADDDGGKGKLKGGLDYQPKTTNEQKEEVLPKPDIQITRDMHITFLGPVEQIVGNMLLIKGAASGDQYVLESGSVLCTEQREVVGVVADTLGKVREPLYTVHFISEQEIQDAGLVHGTKIYYVNDHSETVFTQPLQSMKGTDASNIHDEEVGEDEVEFSDDEEEAAFKSQRKRAKKDGRTALTRTEFQAAPRSNDLPGYNGGHAYPTGRGGDLPTDAYGALSYDDDLSADNFYQPLKRPDNLAQMMGSGAPPPRPPQSFDGGRGRSRGDGLDRGRGRGRVDRGRGDKGRGRGDRGRDRGGFSRDQRGGRGGQRGGSGGPPPSSFSSENTQSLLPPKPNFPHTLPPQQYQAPPPPPAYQFNGQAYQYGTSQLPPAPAAQPSYYATQQPAVPPPSAYSTPAYYPQPQHGPQQALSANAEQSLAWATWYAQQIAQQTPQQPATHPAQQYGLQYQAAAGAQLPPSQQQQQEQSPQLPPNIDLSRIMKRLGGGQ